MTGEAMSIFEPKGLRKLGKIRALVKGGTISMKEAEVMARPYMTNMNLKGAETARKKGEPFTPATLEQFLTIVDAYDRRTEKTPKGVRRNVAANGDIFSTVKNIHDKKTYGVSTVSTGEEFDVWQTAVALVVNKVNDFDKPIFFKPSFSSEGARKTHIETEKMVQNNACGKWSD